MFADEFFHSFFLEIPQSFKYLAFIQGSFSLFRTIICLIRFKEGSNEPYPRLAGIEDNVRDQNSVYCMIYYRGGGGI
jgi:hypothetical protein